MTEPTHNTTDDEWMRCVECGAHPRECVCPGPGQHEPAQETTPPRVLTAALTDKLAAETQRDAARAEAARLREASERIANHAFNEGCRYGVYPITGGGPTAKELVAAALATEARDE